MLALFAVLANAVGVLADLSCPDFKAMAVKVSLPVLQTMGKEDIVECLPFFGARPLENEDGKYVWDALIKVRGTVEEVTDRELKQLGWVLRDVPAEDMGNLTLSEVDTITALGLYRNLSEQQVLAERVAEDWANKTPQEYTYYDLMALNHILCGFNRSSVQAIHADSYKGAAATLSALQGCPQGPLEALATLAQASDAFGPASGWSASQLKNVGCVINGLEVHVLGVIPPAGFESITPDIVPCIYPETFKMLSSAQLSHLTPSAVAALKPQQQSQLSQDQHKTVAAAYEGVQTKPSSGIARQPFLPTLMVANALAQLAHFLFLSDLGPD